MSHLYGGDHEPWPKSLAASHAVLCRECIDSDYYSSLRLLFFPSAVQAEQAGQAHRDLTNHDVLVGRFLG